MKLVSITMTTFNIETQLNEEYNCPRFLIVASKDDQLIKQSFLGIQKLLKCAVGDVKDAKKLCHGNVLIEVKSKSQVDNTLAHYHEHVGTPSNSRHSLLFTKCEQRYYSLPRFS